MFNGLLHTTEDALNGGVYLVEILRFPVQVRNQVIPIGLSRFNFLFDGAHPLTGVLEKSRANMGESCYKNLTLTDSITNCVHGKGLR